MENETESTTVEERKSNKTPLLIAIAALVVLLGAGYLFLNQNKSATAPVSPTPTVGAEISPTDVMGASPSDAMSKDEKVTFTETGFSPASITIKAGTKVTWTNNSGELAAVYSDPHPVHTNYPPLNLGRFNDGESLSLTFDKAGTYGYHDHLDPSKKGTIIVQ